MQKKTDKRVKSGKDDHSRGDVRKADKWIKKSEKTKR